MRCKIPNQATNILHIIELTNKKKKSLLTSENMTDNNQDASVEMSTS